MTLLQIAFASRFDEMKAASSTYWIVVIEDTQNKAVVATGTLVIEKKFTHGAGKVRPSLLYLPEILVLCVLLSVYFLTKLLGRTY